MEAAASPDAASITRSSPNSRRKCTQRTSGASSRLRWNARRVPIQQHCSGSVRRLNGFSVISLMTLRTWLIGPEPLALLPVLRLLPPEFLVLARALRSQAARGKRRSAIGVMAVRLCALVRPVVRLVVDPTLLSDNDLRSLLQRALLHQELLAE